MYIEKGIFDVMAGCSINERMDGLLLQNEEYIKMQNKIEEQIMLFDKLNLTKEQCLVVDRLISAHTESGVNSLHSSASCMTLPNIKSLDIPNDSHIVLSSV